MVAMHRVCSLVQIRWTAASALHDPAAGIPGHASHFMRWEARCRRGGPVREDFCYTSSCRHCRFRARSQWRRAVPDRLRLSAAVVRQPGPDDL